MTAALVPVGTQEASSPIRVAYVVHVMEVAGAEILVAEIIRRLGARLDPVIFCLDAVGSLGQQLAAQGLPVLSFDRRPGKDWRVVGRMAGELRQRRTEVIHAHQYTPFFYSALARAAAGGGPRLIFTEHGRHYPDIVGRGRRWTNRLLLARAANECNAVCGFSARALRALDGFAARTVEVVENGIDPERYDRKEDRPAARRRIGLSDKRRYIANVARFHPVKDHHTLIDAFATVAAARPDVDLVLVGDGPLRRDLESHADRLQLRERVLFLGVRRDVPDILSAVDIFALTSVSEAASITLLEAMASRLPVVVTNVGGNPEIVRDDAEGVLVPRGDSGAVAQSLLRLLDDPVRAKALGMAGAERVRRTYRLDRTVERHYESYRRLVCR